MNSASSELTIRFLGAAGTVTGSKYLLSIRGINILVDCGLFQGLKNLRELNWMDLHFPASEIDHVLLTHGHLDHIGYLPRLVSQGFSGTVHCTFPTVDLAEIILTDSAKIQEEDAEHANAVGHSRHKPALPLYTLKDAEESMELFRGVPADEFITLDEGIKVCFRKNAHIPGASFIEMDVAGKRIVFSGDLGRPNDPMLLPPRKARACRPVVC